MSSFEHRVSPRLLPFACLSLAALVASASLGQEAAKTKAKSSDRPAATKSETYRPTVFPDRVILTLSGDPAHTQAVTWRTDATVTDPVAQIAPADHGPKFESKAKTISAVTTALENESGTAHDHSVIFEGLTPKTKYFYRVGDGAHWSEWNLFQTASAAAEPFCFLYVGDAQNSIKSHWSHLIREAFACAPQARFIVHAGDLVGRGTNDTDWGEWFQAAGWFNTMVASLPSPGNHEYEKAKNDPEPASTLTRHWRAQFELPTNGPAGLEESAYFVDYQGVRLVSLNSSEKQPEQAEWLKKVLGQNPNRWTIVVFHHPFYASAKGRDNAKIRKMWQPIFDHYHVDLVLHGHDHTYARTGLQTASKEDASDSFPVDKRAGTVYVNSVSGPKMYVLDRKAEHKRTAEETQLFQVITINGDTLHFEAHTALGDLYDAFELHRRDGQPNTLMDMIPATPERHPQAETAASR